MSARADAWAWQQKGLSPLIRLALLAFAREADDKGGFRLRRKELAEILECGSLDTVDRRIKALVSDGLLAVRHMKSSGFKANEYRLKIPTKFVFADSRKAAASMIEYQYEDEAPAATPTYAASPSRNPAVIEAATAAASTRDSSEILEGYSDIPIPTSTAVVRPKWISEIVIEAVQSRYLDPDKSHRLITGGGTVQRWIEAGADLNLDVIPTVRRLCVRLNGHGEQITTWNYFATAVRQAVAERKAAEAVVARMGEPDDGQSASASGDHGSNRNGRRNLATSFLLS